MALPSNVQPTTDLFEALSGAQALVLGVPSVYVAALLPRLFSALSSTHPPLLSIVKGVLDHADWQISRHITAHYAGPFSVLSGPNLASEIATEKPAATVIASQDLADAQFFQQLLHRPYFRVYTTTDVAGVELGGVIKNIFAISAGICDGLGLGQNAKAALLTRALREMTRFGEAMGGQSATFYGLSGLGDLMATCNSDASRNWKVGFAVAQGQSLPTSSAVPEGVRTALHFAQLADDLQLDLPVISLTAAILKNEIRPFEALQKIMDRELKTEL